MLDVFSQRQVDYDTLKVLYPYQKGKVNTAYNVQGYLTSKQPSVSKTDFSIIRHSDLKNSLFK